MIAPMNIYVYTNTNYKVYKYKSECHFVNFNF